MLTEYRKYHTHTSVFAANTKNKRFKESALMHRNPGQQCVFSAVSPSFNELPPKMAFETGGKSEFHEINAGKCAAFLKDKLLPPDLTSATAFITRSEFRKFPVKTRSEFSNITIKTRLEFGIIYLQKERLNTVEGLNHVPESQNR